MGNGNFIRKELKEREIYKTFVIYVAGSWGIVEALDFFSNRFSWPQYIFDLVLVTLICGLPFTLIKAWFHAAPGSQKTSRMEFILIGVNAVIAIILLSITLTTTSDNHPKNTISSAKPTSSRSIAVLPFMNLSNDPEQEYFSDGITEDILNHLAKASRLKVKSRTSTWKYRNVQQDIKQIGNELGVTSILQGSIRKVDNVVRIVVHLIDVASDEQLWSETYDREMKDVFRVQSEIAIAVVRTLNTILTQAEKNHIAQQATADISAYDYFLKARQIINQSNDIRRDYDNALQLLDRAIELDPDFAASYALKATVWRWLGTYGTNFKTWIDSALYYSTKAVELNPTLPDGYLVRSNIYSILNNRDKSKSDLLKAYEVSPNDPSVLETLGYELLYNNDERGAAMILESLEARYSKKDPEYYWILGWIHFNAENYEMAEILLQKGKSLAPESIEPCWRLAFVYRALKKYKESVKESEQAIGINPSNPTMIDNMAWAYFLNGEWDKAATYWSKYPEIENNFQDSTQHVPFRHRLGYISWLKGNKTEAIKLFKEEIKLEQRVIDGKAGAGVWPTAAKASNFYDLAACKSFLGAKKEAVAYLDSAITNGLDFDWGFKYDPLFENQRTDPEFVSVVAKALSRKQFVAKSLRRALRDTNS